MARVLLGVSGGIAAYKAVEFVRLAMDRGHSVRVLMTPNARHFIGESTFEGVTGAPVLHDEFQRDPLRGSFPGDESPSHDPIGHLAVAMNADAMLVAPASAGTVAKLAAGMADSMLTTSFLACTAPRLVAPAMNDRMYRDDAVQTNLATLASRGVVVIEPSEGRLASRGEHGIGRLPEPAALLERVEAALPTPGGSWDGLKVLVSAGGTREPVDSVRFLGNRSSGRMGLAVAERARARGAEVTLVAANVSLDTPSGVERIDVSSTEEMATALGDRFAESDVLVMAAAPADFRPTSIPQGKLERGDGLKLELEPTEDILADLGSKKAGQVVVGFAAEAGDDEERAREKLRRKGADLIVMNDISNPEIGFDSVENEARFVDADASFEVSRRSKSDVADALLDRIELLLAERTQERRA